eukprot:jgi/Bigna1/147302/aug1.139_g22010
MSTKLMKVILGTMEMGRGVDSKQSLEMIQNFMEEGYSDLDTAIMYCGGKTEKILGEIKMGTNEAVHIATKVNPIGSNSLTEASIRQQFHLSLERLGTKCVDILYLHMPDHETDINVSLKAINDLHKEKKFVRFGLSNYASWQGELFPCLRHLKMVFYAYNPLAGGLLSGKYSYVDKDSSELPKTVPKGRFNGVGGRWASAYRDRFWNKPNFEGIELVKIALADSYGEGKVSLVDATMRWLIHHSKLSADGGDGVIIGASKMKHFSENVKSLKNAKPLDKRVVNAFDAAWKLSKPSCPKYYR